MTSFSDLHLAEPIARVLGEAGYDTPTPIQKAAIPPALQGRDILGIAQTGTGKTLAFCAPLLQRWSAVRRELSPKEVRILVLAPTRELANQIAESFQVYGRLLMPSIAVVFGGVSIGMQVKRMHRGADILVATPGRLLDLVERSAIDLRKVEALVLDEADQMLDMGFIHSLKRIARMIPRERQTLFFSATMPKAIADLADDYIDDPVRVEVTPQATTVERIDQRLYMAGNDVKPALLMYMLAKEANKSTLVFTRTKHGADRVVKQLKGSGVDSAAIHGNKSQPQRDKALALFKSGKVKVLVATDIAARGIDISGITHVINYEMPNVPEQYVHRIGRTARAGADGQALSFVAPDERAFLRSIEKVTNQRLQREALPSDVDLIGSTIAIKEAAAQIRTEDPLQKHGKGGGRPPRGDRSERGDGGYGRRPARAPRANAPFEPALADASDFVDAEIDRKPAYSDKPRGDRPYGDRPREDRPRGERPFGDKPRGDRPYGDRPREDRPRGDRPFGDRPREDRPRGDRPFGDKPRGERPYGDKPREDRPRGDRPFGDKPRGDRPYGDKPREDRPRGDRSFGDKPRGERPYGDKPREDRPYGDRPREDRPRGDRPYGDKPRGDRPYGDKPRGDRPYGDRPYGDRPREDRPRGDRPYGDKPREDRPRGDRPYGDKPREDRPRGDRPYGDKPREDRPRGDRPYGDKPREDRPRDDRPRDGAGGGRTSGGSTGKPYGKPGGRPAGRPASSRDGKPPRRDGGEGGQGALHRREKPQGAPRNRNR
jgi:ATP-dependent RNA helicase RhlE